MLGIKSRRFIGIVISGLSITVTSAPFAAPDAIDQAEAEVASEINALNHMICASLNKPGTVNADGSIIPGGVHYDFSSSEMEKAMRGMVTAGTTRNVSIPQPLTPYIASVCDLSEPATTMLSVLQSIPGMEGWTGRWGEPLTAPVSKYQVVGQWELLGIRGGRIFKMDTGMVIPTPLHMGGGMSVIVQGTIPGGFETDYFWLDCLGHFRTTAGETPEQMVQGQLGPLGIVPDGSILNEAEQRICKYAPQE